jgi:hypothetical protein
MATSYATDPRGRIGITSIVDASGAAAKCRRERLASFASAGRTIGASGKTIIFGGRQPVVSALARSRGIA